MTARLPKAADRRESNGELDLLFLTQKQTLN